MSGQTLDDSDTTDTAKAGQDEPATIRARSRADVVRHITDASLRFGFPSLPQAVRTVMTIFADSAKVQEAIRRDLPLGVLKPRAESK